MAYVLNLFTPATWQAFRDHGEDITGFSKAHLSRARNLVKPGDIFICYMVRLSRWCGALEVISGPFEDNTPIFESPDDPWTVRFSVRTVVALDPHTAIPIELPEIWNQFSKTKGLSLNSSSWAVKAGLQSSLVRISEEDGSFLFGRLKIQSTQLTTFPLTEQDEKNLTRKAEIVNTPSGPVSVVVPSSEDSPEAGSQESDHELVRYSIQMQATLVSIGLRLGFDVWVPRSDRSRVGSSLIKTEREVLLDKLPLNYNDSTLKTIENIDVLWLRKRRIVRAFEIEHTTAIYSGLLRMADLLALQPNIDIKLHIVAPADRRDKVFEEIQRPVFSLLEKGPLADSCSYLRYEAISDLSAERHLSHMNDSILEEYEEYASEA